MYKLYPNTKLFQKLYPDSMVKGKYILVKLGDSSGSKYFTEMDERIFNEYAIESIKDITKLDSYKKYNLPDLLLMLNNSDIMASKFPCKETEDFRNYILTKINRRCNK